MTALHVTRPSLAGIEQRAEARASYADERSETEHDPEEYSALADGSAADVPALTAAVRAVLAEHPQSGHRLVGSPRADREEAYCTGCQRPAPCPTIRAISKHVDLTEGDPT